MTDQPTTQAQLIERAARAMRNRWSMQTPPTDENYADAAAVARHGLLGDPEQGAEGWAVRCGEMAKLATQRTAERDALQARIDKALKFTRNPLHWVGVPDELAAEVRAALQGEE